MLDIAWDTINEAKSNEKRMNYNSMSIHQLSGLIADEILTNAAKLKSFDNLTLVIISFKNLENYFFER